MVNGKLREWKNEHRKMAIHTKRTTHAPFHLGNSAPSFSVYFCVNIVFPFLLCGKHPLFCTVFLFLFIFF